MKFELNDYHRNLTDEQILQDIKSVATALEKNSITADDYDRNGQYHSSTARHRFGSWKNVLERAGLSIDGHNFPIADQEYIADLQRIARELGENTITSTQYSQYGKFDSMRLSKRFGGWNKALEASGLQLTGYRKSIPDEELFADLLSAWTLLGRQPTSTDVKNGITKSSLNTFSRRFGSWRHALEAFVQFMNQESESDNDIDNSEIRDITGNNIENKEMSKHKTKREPNLRMRYKVLTRDNYKCCICGASPASDPSVRLHLDHIVPWSKGGETTLENLQTLCSKCNYGKSDIMMDKTE